MQRHHDHLPAAHQRGHHVGRDRDREDQERAGEDARHAEREGDAPEGGPAVGAEAARGLLQRRVDAPDDADQREHHEGQGELHEPHHRAEEVVHQRQRLADGADVLEDAVDDPVVAHQHHQAEQADHHVELHRAQHEDHVEGVAPRMPSLGDEIGQRVAQRECNHRNNRRQPDRTYRRLVVERAVEEADVVLEREVPLDVDHARDRLVEGDQEQRDGRDDEEDQEERESRQHQPIELGVGEKAPKVRQRELRPRLGGSKRHLSVCSPSVQDTDVAPTPRPRQPVGRQPDARVYGACRSRVSRPNG